MSAPSTLFQVISTTMACFALAQTQSPPPPLTFRSRTDLVWVDVSVRNGRVPVAGLMSADFELLDNGVPQRVEALDIEAIPIDVSLVLDTSGSTVDAIDQFKRDVRAMVGLLRPVDRVRVVTFATDVQELVPMQPATRPVDVQGLKAGGATSLNDGLLYALALPGFIDRRHLVVVFTDGDDTSSTLDAESTPAIAGRADAVLYAVLCNPAGSPVKATVWNKASHQALIDAAARTGGDVHQLDDAVAALRGILDDFRQRYVLRFTPAGVAPGGWHELTVRIVKPGAAGYAVRSRKGYAG